MKSSSFPRGARLAFLTLASATSCVPMLALAASATEPETLKPRWIQFRKVLFETSSRSGERAERYPADTTTMSFICR